MLTIHFIWLFSLSVYLTRSPSLRAALYLCVCSIDLLAALWKNQEHFSKQLQQLASRMLADLFSISLSSCCYCYYFALVLLSIIIAVCELMDFFSAIFEMKQNQKIEKNEAMNID